MSITDFWPFLVAFSGLVAAGLGVPIPEELPIVGAGIWAASDTPVGSWKWLILPVCILGVVISDGLLYGIGRWWGPALLDRPWIKRILSDEKRQKIENNFAKYGVKILLGARLLPGIRSPIFIMAGVLRLDLKRFILADGIYAIPGVSLLFFLSYWFTDQFRDLIEAVEKQVNHLRPILILLALLGVAAYFAWHFWKKPVSTGDPKELPRIIDKVVEKHSPLDSIVERLAPGEKLEPPEKDKNPPPSDHVAPDGPATRPSNPEQGKQPGTNNHPPGPTDGQTSKSKQPSQEKGEEKPRKREEVG